MREREPSKEGRVVIYSGRGLPEVRVRLDGDSVWLNRRQIAELFGRDVKTIGKHISNALTEELRDFSTVAKFATVQCEGGRKVERQVEHYNLDVILSVGYRVKSAEGVRFRIWAGNVLRRYVTDGAVLNEKRLLEQKNEQLSKLLSVVSRLVDKKSLKAGESEEVLGILARYGNGFLLLDEYDRGLLEFSGGLGRTRFVITHGYVRRVLVELADEMRRAGQAGELFGILRGNLDGIVEGIYQSFDGQELYKSLEEKAANLFYQIIKDHPFIDGNKRIAAFLLVVFLRKNRYEFLKSGERKISDRTIVALAILTAESKPTEKDSIVALICNLLKSS